MVSHPASLPVLGLARSIRKLSSFAGLVILLAAFAVPSHIAQAANDPGDRSEPYKEHKSDNTATHQEIAWIGPGGEKGVGLFLFRAAEFGFTERLFIKTPEGQHLILQRTLRSGSGLDRSRLIDDQTGWWLEVTKDYGFTATSLRKFFSIAEDLVKGSGRSVGYTLRVAGGLEWSTEVPAQQPVNEHASVAQELRGTDLGRALEEHVRGDLAMTLAFLACTPTYERLGPAGGVLVSLWSASSTGTGSCQEKLGPLRVGLSLSDPKLVRLRAEFATPLKSLWDVRLDQPIPPGKE